LDIVQVTEARRSTDRGVNEVAIGCRIHFKDECGKEDVESEAKHANESTSALSLMGAQAVQRLPKVRDVEAIPDEDFLPFKEMMAGHTRGLEQKKCCPCKLAAQRLDNKK
jgi:hypothetical protein